MTVCIAAMAQNSRAMVLCADRQRTAGETRHQGRIAKKREIGYGWRFLYEGFGTRADELERLVEKGTARVSVGANGITEADVREIVRVQFADLLKSAFEKGQIKSRTRLDLGLLLVGFNEDNNAVGYIFNDRGVYEQIREVGYGVIGSGQDPANATLAQYGIPMDDDLWKVMYKVYEAKRRSDALTVSVGSPTDMWIMTEHAQRQSLRGDTYVEWPAGPIMVIDRIIKNLKELYEWNVLPPWDRPRDPPSFSQQAVQEYAYAVMRTKATDAPPS